MNHHTKRLMRMSWASSSSDLQRHTTYTKRSNFAFVIAQRQRTLHGTRVLRKSCTSNALSLNYYLKKNRRTSRTSLLHSSSTSTIDQNLVFHDSISVQEIIEESVDLLEGNNVTEPLLSTCHLLSHALEIPWEENGFSLLLDIAEESNNNNNPFISSDITGDQILTTKQIESYSSMIQRRLKNEPIQYILGKWDFYDFQIKCKKPILCPRSETEELVQIVLDEINTQQQTEKQKIRILDIGCGTGAIGVALAKHLAEHQRQEKRMTIDVVAIDILKEAVELTQENVEFVLSPFTSNKEKDSTLNFQVHQCSAIDFISDEKFDVVVSNPPYIPKHDMLTLSSDVVSYESHDALCGGVDGMDVIRDIIHQLPLLLVEGDAGICWMEVDTSHPKLIEEFLNTEKKQQQQPTRFVEGRKDLYGRDRFVKLNVNNSTS